VSADTPLFDRVETWIKHDPDPSTRAEIAELLEKAKSRPDEEGARARAELEERFAGPLAFGTAGLRGLIGGGESRMNRAVIRRTTYGLGKYLLAVNENAARVHGVVIGYDGRHMGREFAEDTARVLAALGIPSKVTPGPCPTPLTAFALLAEGAAAGIMVTASHNPPAYNGYKVYWGNGAQIIPPHDLGIAARIDKAPPADEINLADGGISVWPAELELRYLDAIQALGVRSDGDRSIKIVYTPLHGTGNRLVRLVFERAGFDNVETVPAQAEPDGDFPTVAFPNPEEPGALDLAYGLGKREDAALIIANDPDVDRLAVAVRDKHGGNYVQLTGNQVGALLGHYLLTQGKDKGAEKRLTIASLVSSPMLGVMARALGVRYEETLTGFKWIANRAMELEQEGYRFVFGFEEALGYTVGSLVRDKDGIGAALLLAELAAVRHAEGKTLLDELEDLSRRYGLFVSSQKSITLPGQAGLAQIGLIMDRLRASPPLEIGAYKVVAMNDYKKQIRTSSGGSTSVLSLPPSNVLAFELEGNNRVIARPSGTEPKIKFYFDLCEPMTTGEALHDAEGRARGKVAELTAAFCAIAGV